MSYPKRAKGWRPVTVNQQQFRWLLRRGGESYAVVLQGTESSGQQAIVTLHGWYDVWDFVGHFDKLPNSPRVITAHFAAQAIQFALIHGWHPEQAGSPMRLDYHNASGVLSQTIGDHCHSTLLHTTNDKPQLPFPVFRRLDVP